MIAVTTMTNTNALDLVLPNSAGQSDQGETISVSIDGNFNYFLDQEQLPIEQLEAALQQKLAGQKEPNIVLHVAKEVPIENAVKVMDIAYRNQYKIVLAVAPK
jgi:biopolymer transport protein ExbD